MTGFPLVMGILNATPDSFHGKSRVDAEAAARLAAIWEEQGADVIDIGGESTRPGSQPISAAEELERVLPVLKAVRKSTKLPISIDTTKPSVLEACVSEGAEWLNDISALEDPQLGEVASKYRMTVILMHKKGQPSTMQDAPFYANVVEEVRDFLKERTRRAVAMGLAPERVWVDPGIGFGKTIEHNLQLLQSTEGWRPEGFRVAVGLSRKRWIGDIAGEGDRLAGSVLGAVYAWKNGAGLVRVHDVPETIQAFKVYQKLWMN